MSAELALGIAMVVARAADTPLSFYDFQRWLREHVPAGVRVAVNLRVVFGLLMIGILVWIWKSFGRRKKSPRAEQFLGVERGVPLNRDTNIVVANNPSGRSAFNPRPMPRLVAKYLINVPVKIPGAELPFNGAVAAFHNDVKSEEDPALNVIAHLTFRLEQTGEKIEVHQALWNERNQSSINIFMGATAHVIVAAHVPDSRPSTYLAMDAAYDETFAVWRVTKGQVLPYGDYHLLIEITAQNYRVLFRARGELSEKANLWSQPVEAEGAPFNG